MPPEDDPRDDVRSEPCPECDSPTIFIDDEDLWHCTNIKCHWLIHDFDKELKCLRKP